MLGGQTHRLRAVLSLYWTAEGIGTRLLPEKFFPRLAFRQTIAEFLQHSLDVPGWVPGFGATEENFIKSLRGVLLHEIVNEPHRGYRTF